MRALIAASLIALGAPAFADDLKGEAEKPDSAADMVAAGLQPDTYRFGGTYAYLNASDAGGCASSCSADSDCVSWTFIAESRAEGARCELKVSMGRSEYRPGATSGFSANAFRVADMSFRSAEPEPVEVAEAPDPEAVEVVEAPIVTASAPSPKPAAAPADPKMVEAKAETTAPAAPATPAGKTVIFGEAPTLTYDVAETDDKVRTEALDEPLRLTVSRIPTP